MDNPEDYVLRVLRRTQLGLQDSLIPAHGEKFALLVEKLDLASSLSEEIERLKSIEGFYKPAVCMEWFLRRLEKTGEEFSPDQFESDILLLNEKLFEAFLNQPFDAPVPMASEEAPVEQSLPTRTEEGPAPESEPVTILSEPDWTAPPTQPAVPEPSFEPPQRESSASLAEILDQSLILSVERFAQSASALMEKPPVERGVSFSVMKMIAKGSVDTATAQGKVAVVDFFQAIMKLISHIEESGKARENTVAEVMHDIGDRLTHALHDTSNGMRHMKSIMNFIMDPKELIGK